MTEASLSSSEIDFAAREIAVQGANSVLGVADGAIGYRDRCDFGSDVEALEYPVAHR